MDAVWNRSSLQEAEMRIAQVAPLVESVPPTTYGGIERVVHYLTESLVERGHDVTLFASGDSKTAADLVAVAPQSLRAQNRDYDPCIWHLRQLAEVIRMVDKFDLVHFHVDYFHFPVCRCISTPQLTTLHGRLDFPDLDVLYNEYKDMPIVSISNAQRRPLPNAGWFSTVYNGIPANDFTYHPHPGNYLAFLGRFAPEKGPEAAIEIAIRTNTPLKMAAKIDAADRQYFDQKIKAYLEHPLIEYIGEADTEKKVKLLGGAKALLFPIDWPEPFGLVMTEAMACGTPVIAFRNGSVDEVMRDGVSGFIVENIEQAIDAVGKLDSISREACRQHFEAHFSVKKMVDGYLSVYNRLLSKAKIVPFTAHPEGVLNNMDNRQAN